MKKILYLWACVPFLGAACSEQAKLAENEVLIEGRISNVEDGAVITLFRHDGDFGMSIAKDTIENGRFAFKAEAVSDPEKMSVMSFDEGYPSSRSLEFWVAPGKKTKITGGDKMVPAWRVKNSVPYQKEENRYADKSRDIIRRMVELDIDRDDLNAKAEGDAPEEQRTAYRRSADSLHAVQDSLLLMTYIANIDILEREDVTPIWLDKLKGMAAMLDYVDSNAEYVGYVRKKAEELYAGMSEEEKNTPDGYQITAYLFPPPTVGVGDSMADGDLLDTNGDTKHLSDYLGKYLLLDFWSRGCGPCIMALPEMKEAPRAIATA